MYTEFDSLKTDDLNNIEDKVNDLYTQYSSCSARSYTKKTWTDDEFVYVDDIKNIEDAIEYLGYGFGYPDGWQKSRDWDLTGTNNISYKDLNRWLNNIKILADGDFNPLLPSDSLYPSDTLYPSNRIER